MRRTRRKATAGFAPVLLVASLLSVATASPASGVTGLDPSTQAAIVGTLRSIGVDPSDAVWQRGLRNYAGPTCPGAGWNCVTATAPIVQIAPPIGVNQFHCTRPNCVVVQATMDDDDDEDDDDDDGDDDANVATCQMSRSSSSSSSTVLQVCFIEQMQLDGNSRGNEATIKQTIKQSNGSRTSTQNARQVARITQTNSHGRNIASITQTINQSQNAYGGAAISQTQEAHQAGTVDQLTETGKNVSTIKEAQYQSQRGSSATTIDQKQNTVVEAENGCDQPGGPYGQQKNQCAEVAQDSNVVPATGGRNHSTLDQDISENQSASYASTATQEQGEEFEQSGSFAFTGQAGTVDQLSSAPVQSLATQDTVQAQSATGVPALGLRQNKDAGDPRCCQTQGTNLNSRADIIQKTKQVASSPTAIQQALFNGNCVTSGTCSVLQSATINGETETNDSCTDSSFCSETFVCAGVGEASDCNGEFE